MLGQTWWGKRRRGEGADVVALLQPARESWAAAPAACRRRVEEEESSPRMAAAVADQWVARALLSCLCRPARRWAIPSFSSEYTHFH